MHHTACPNAGNRRGNQNSSSRQPDVLALLEANRLIPNEVRALKLDHVLATIRLQVDTPSKLHVLIWQRAHIVTNVPTNVLPGNR